MTATASNPGAGRIILLLLVISGVAVGGLLALTFLVLGAFAWFNADPASALTLEMGALAFGVLAACGLPAAYWMARGWRGSAAPEPSRPAPEWVLAAALFPVGLSLGHLAFGLGVVPALLGPPAHLLATGVPVLLAVFLVRRLSPPLPPGRVWSALLAGAWILPVLAFLVELAVGLALLAVVVSLLMLTPEGAELLRRLIELDSITGGAADILLMEELVNSWLVIPAFTYLAALVPLIEEAAKGAVLWPILRRTAAGGQAFAVGAIAGAGFGLSEALFVAQPDSGWQVVIIGRVGTTFMHAFSAGIVSLAVFHALTRRSWRRLAAGYGGAVLIHGLWNFLALRLWINQWNRWEGATVDSIPQLFRLDIASWGLVLLSGLAFVGLLLVARAGGKG